MPTSFAHWVFGTPPRHRNRKLVSIIRSSPVSQFLSVTARNMSSPCNATTSDLGTISMFGVCVTRSTRYSQTLASHDDTDLASVAGKVQRGLCGRIACTHDDDVFIATKLGLACASS